MDGQSDADWGASTIAFELGLRRDGRWEWRIRDRRGRVVARHEGDGYRTVAEALTSGRRATRDTHPDAVLDVGVCGGNPCPRPQSCGAVGRPA